MTCTLPNKDSVRPPQTQVRERISSQVTNLPPSRILLYGTSLALLQTTAITTVLSTSVYCKEQNYQWAED